MLTYGQFLVDHARNLPERAAVISAKRCLSYEELNKESNVVANALSKRGIRKGDAVAILAANSVEWVVIWQACQKTGAVCVPLHARWKADELIRVLRMTQCAALFCEKSLEETARLVAKDCQHLRELVCFEEAKEGDTPFWETVFGEAEEQEAQQELEEQDPALILFTSGTTGMPKGVMRTQQMILLHAMSLSLINDNTVTCVMLTMAPLYHSGGLLCLLKTMLLGGTLLLQQRFEPGEVLRMIRDRQPTQVMLLPPIMYERLYQSDAWNKTPMTCVREVCLSAGRSTCELAGHIFEMFPDAKLRPSWGSTEACSITGGLLSREELQKNPERIKCVGKANPMTQIRIVDAGGSDVRDGEAGEAIVKSPMVFSGYLQTDAPKREIFTKDGWYRTGDMMRRDPVTGCYYFVDRIKDIIKTGGESVSALEVERVIQSHPSVEDCAVVGVPDAHFEEGIAAAIVLKPGCTLSAEELTAHCRNALASYKKPRYMAIVDSLPVNSVGKVQKTRLREQGEKLFRPIYAE